MSVIKLPVGLYRRLVAEATAVPLEEVCGLLAGSERDCSAVYPVVNISPTPECSYYMDPRGQIDAMAAMRRSGETMIGIYHSHPTTPAVPSARDLAEAAYPGLAYLIISLRYAARPEVAAFAFERGGFEPIRLALESGDPR